ncbi:MAG TPA: nicotinate phosphoribosyltransferase [Gammaproteobacteria bacterium]|nr:nicotinate phosphoribosyltransferase [Gammaproteobacteria bacterium]
MQSFTLLTDLYQLTMAYGYWRLNRHEQPSVFHLIYRKNPFQGNFALSCGLANVIDYLKNFRFSDEDLAYLKTLTNPLGEPLWDEAFLSYLKNLRFSCDLAAIPEGTVVSPHEPLLRLQGPLLQCQLLESPLLNIINFQTLIATKAARVCQAAQGDAVIEFGMRRAQGPDGALSASRAAYVGGCVATSNALAGKQYDLPVRGTHAHSWVTAFPDELAAFEAYAKVMPHNVILLVDTYDSLKGVQHAITIAKKLREHHSKLYGIRLDSGNMAAISIQARAMLDEAGLTDTVIMASNSLDEYAIRRFKAEGAKISVWGVGTHLVTASDCSALDGVYKLSSLQNEKGEWEYKLKISDDPIKTSNPGIHQVRRFYSQGRALIDVLYDLALGIADYPQAVLFDEAQTPVEVQAYDSFVDLLIPIFRQGHLVYQAESIHTLREQASKNVADFLQQRGENSYPVAIEKNLYEKKRELVIEARARNKD